MPLLFFVWVFIVFENVPRGTFYAPSFFSSSKVNKENVDVGGRNSWYARGLANCCRADAGEFLAGFDGYGCNGGEVKISRNFNLFEPF